MASIYIIGHSALPSEAGREGADAAEEEEVGIRNRGQTDEAGRRQHLVDGEFAHGLQGLALASWPLGRGVDDRGITAPLMKEGLHEWVDLGRRRVDDGRRRRLEAEAQSDGGGEEEKEGEDGRSRAKVGAAA